MAADSSLHGPCSCMWTDKAFTFTLVFSVVTDVFLTTSGVGFTPCTFGAIIPVLPCGEAQSDCKLITKNTF